MLALILLAACDSDSDAVIPPDGVTSDAVIRLVPPDGVTAPAGTVPVVQRRSDVAPDTDAPDRTLGNLGFTGTLEATLSQGVHAIDVLGDFDDHPGCEEPDEPQSSCSPSGWGGYAFVEVFGPDWAPGDAGENTPDVQIAEGEVGEVVITVSPQCACDD